MDAEYTDILPRVRVNVGGKAGFKTVVLKSIHSIFQSLISLA